MFSSNNILLFMLAILPVFVYSFLIYTAVPSRLISLRRSRKYIVAGFISPMIVVAFHYMFPNFGEMSPFPTVADFALSAFIQVALIEEAAKYLTFEWTSSQRRSASFDLPVATMFYAMLSSAGFALMENVQYLMGLGQQVLAPRAITAVALHMMCGVIMGYFLAKSISIKIPHENPINPIQDLENDMTRFKKFMMKMVGVGCAALMHGFYDLNLFLPFNVYDKVGTMFTLLAGIAICSLMFKELIAESVQLRKTNYNKDGEK
jgi:RsiW-degrading membrane proteinase PrsW (M82 family)